MGILEKANINMDIVRKGMTSPELTKKHQARSRRKTEERDKKSPN